MSDAQIKLLVVSVILVAALFFYFFGQGLLNTAEAPEAGPTPNAAAVLFTV